jgi:hypothetical protein
VAGRHARIQYGAGGGHRQSRLPGRAGARSVVRHGHPPPAGATWARQGRSVGQALRGRKAHGAEFATAQPSPPAVNQTRRAASICSVKSAARTSKASSRSGGPASTIRTRPPGTRSRTRSTRGRSGGASGPDNVRLGETPRQQPRQPLRGAGGGLPWQQAGRFRSAGWAFSAGWH